MSASKRGALVFTAHASGQVKVTIVATQLLVQSVLSVAARGLINSHESGDSAPAINNVR